MHGGSSTLMIIIDLMKIGDTASGWRLSTHCSVRQRGGVPQEWLMGKEVRDRKSERGTGKGKRRWERPG